jgi:hypothetical protein
LYGVVYKRAEELTVALEADGESGIRIGKGAGFAFALAESAASGHAGTRTGRDHVAKGDMRHFAIPLFAALIAIRSSRPQRFLKEMQSADA